MSSSAGPAVGTPVIHTVYFQRTVLHKIPFPSPAMPTPAVTTGLVPLVIGSVVSFQLDPWLDGQPWQNLSSVTFTLQDPLGNQTVITATISGNSVTATWTVAGPAGNWTCCWTVTDQSGVKQVSRSIPLSVQPAP